MPGRRLIALPVLAVLTALAILATVTAPAPSHSAPTISPLMSTLEPDDDLLAAVVPDQRDAVAAQAETMPRYTIAATLLLPGAAPGRFGVQKGR